jgi:hypothetical protein
MTISKEQLFSAALKVFGKWKPSNYQRQVFESVFVGDAVYVFCEWSRGAGKTTVALKLALLAAQLFPNRSVLYITPTGKDGKGIISDKRMDFPKELMADKSRPSEGLFRFKNGSELQILGSEGEVAVGREPILVIYDEYRKHDPKAHETISPVLRNGGKLVIISTPPRLNDIQTKKADHYMKMLNFCKKDKDARYFRVTVDEALKEGISTQKFIEFEKRQYEERGEINEFKAEYYLEYVYRSQDSYFCDISESILVPTSNMARLVEAISEPTWIIFGDSSGSTRWGALFACLDEEKGILYLVDSVLRTREGQNTTENREISDMVPSRFWPLLQFRIQKWLPNSTESNWYIGWDRDTTFVDVIPLMFGSHIDISIVEKKYDKKRETFALVRDLIKLNKLYIGEDCKDLIAEMKLLAVDPKTNDFVKKNDELLDCLRYLIMTFDSCFETREALPNLSPLNFWEQAAQKHFANLMKNEEDPELENLMRPEGFW